MSIVIKSIEYISFFQEIKDRIHKAQVKASLAVNKELIILYWDIGRRIALQQQNEGWGTSVIERLAKDIQKSFPNLKGFSLSNLRRMKAFFLSYSNSLIKHAQVVRELEKQGLPQLVAEIPWGHNIILIEKVKNISERFWYIQKTIENGWSRNVLVHQIESGLYHRQGKAISNFPETLPPPQSDLAQQLLKDPYTFDFLTIGEKAKERELEEDLLLHLKDFLIELGKGFAFVGSQYQLEVGDKDFYIDLLFYHTQLHSYVVIDLKLEDFKPEFAGKMNFYLSAIDDLLRHKDDQPSIGIILCKTRNKIIAEYALRDTKKPMGVATYRLTKYLPDKLKANLPSIKELQKELGNTFKRG